VLIGHIYDTVVNLCRKPTFLAYPVGSLLHKVIQTSLSVASQYRLTKLMQ